jgi:hypothetical protein
MRSASSPGILDLRDRGERFWRHLLVELHIVFELLDHGAAERLGLGRAAPSFRHIGDLGLVVLGLVGEAGNAGAGPAFDQHLYGAVGQLQELQDSRDNADVVDRLGRGIVVVFVLLGGQQDLLALVAHGFFERAHGFLAADEERYGLVREDHDVPQRQNGEDLNLGHDA